MNSIEDLAFSGCSGLTAITIPNSVTSIGDEAFSGCTSLVSIAVQADNVNYSIKDGVLFDKKVRTLIWSPNSKTGEYIIPNSVTRIDRYAFSGCSGLTTMTIPSGVTNIGRYAFSGCSGLSAITIPNSIAWIEDGAFFGCTSLNSVTMPDSIIGVICVENLGIKRGAIVWTKSKQ